MYLEKLEIHGFKSFVNKTILTFPKGSTRESVTSVVGPNGSGKSNVVDAIRWVLGEQSLKTIRCKKTEDILFSGSQKKSSVSVAEGSVYLNNDKKNPNIPYSQLVITRRVYRDGENEYFINKNKVRLLDILLLLARLNIGAKSFSIVGQGMIDNVITSTPLERKNFFDEAVGIREFQIKRKQALSKLERSENNLDQSGQLLQEIKPRLRILTKQVEKLKKKEKLQKEIAIIQEEYYKRLWGDLHKQLQENKNKIQEIAQVKDEQDFEMSAIKEGLNDLEQEASRNSVFSELQFKLETLTTEKNSLLREQTLLKGRMDIEYEKQGKLNLVWLHKREDEIEQITKETKQNLEQLKETETSTKKLLEKQETVHQDINKQILKTENEIIHLKNDINHKIVSGPLELIDKNINEILLLQDKFIKKLLAATTSEEIQVLNQEALSIKEKLQILLTKIKGKSLESEIKERVNVNESDKILTLKTSLEKLLKEKEKVHYNINEYKLDLRILTEKYSILNKETEKLDTEKSKLKVDIKTQTPTENKEELKKQFNQENDRLNKRIGNIDNETQNLKLKITKFNEEEEKKKEALFALERKYQSLQNELNKTISQINDINIDVAKIETKKENLEIDLQNESIDLSNISKNYSVKNEDLQNIDNETLFDKIQKIKRQLEFIGGIDPETLKDYEETKERYEFLDTQITDLQDAIISLEKIIIKLDEKIKVQFDIAFNKINKEFERYFKILFVGGKAKLTKISNEEKLESTLADKNAITNNAEENKEDTENKNDNKNSTKQTKAEKYKKRLHQGIDIYACPPGKKLAGIEMLSGGERSLTAVALIAAIISNNECPFVIMDEVDAALDEANSAKIASIVKDLSSKTQFILITHNRTIMSIADFIYGVTMTDEGVSKLLSIKLEEINNHSSRL